ncbi:MAG TPA: hypothetical protein VF986_03235 [Actinomycetota bacterium]
MGQQQAQMRIRKGRGWLALRTFAAGAVLLVLLVQSTGALAHEGEQEVPAKTLVQEAIAIIEGQPDRTDAINDKIGDALEAKDTEGVDLDLVQQAQAAFEAGDMQKTLLLLEQSVGARPGEPVVSPNAGPRTPPPPTSPAPPPAHLRALDRSRVGGIQGTLLLAAAVVLVLAGGAIARRLR